MKFSTVLSKDKPHEAGFAGGPSSQADQGVRRTSRIELNFEEFEAQTATRTFYYSGNGFIFSGRFSRDLVAQLQQVNCSSGREEI
jgi:hypothetical protein